MLLLGFVVLLLAFLPVHIWSSADRVAAASSTLLDQARLATWYSPAQADPPVVSHGYQGTDLVNGFQESDFIYAGGKYYLFSTSSQDPAWVDVYVGNTPENIVKGPPAFTHVAPIRYPTVVKDGKTWHMWGVNPKSKTTEHWVSTNSDPIDFTYADSIFSGPQELPLVDFAVRKDPSNGHWYGVGFETWTNSPLLLAKASNPYGPWQKLNYKPNSYDSGVFGDTGPPPWANASRPDPDLAFTPDGRAWVFFTGRSVTPEPLGVPSIAGMVQVDVHTGKALGNAIVLFDPDAQQDLPFEGVSDLNLISAPGQPPRIFGQTGSADYPLAELDLSTAAPPTDGRTSADLVRLNMARGVDVATGIVPTNMRAPYSWYPAGLIVGAGSGGVTSYLAASYLADLTFQVDFTPATINPSAINAVAHVGGLDYNVGPDITVQIDATNKNKPDISATITGSDNSTVTLDSGIAARPDTNYSVMLSRVGSSATLMVNGVVTSKATQGALLTGLQEWSLAGDDTLTQTARSPFEGTIHSFVVTGSGPDD